VGVAIFISHTANFKPKLVRRDKEKEKNPSRRYIYIYA
jgi:hypothetical protein